MSDDSKESAEGEVTVIRPNAQYDMGAHLAKGDESPRTHQRRLEDLKEQQEIEEMNDLAEKHREIVKQNDELYRKQFGKQTIVRYFKFFISFVLVTCLMGALVFNIHNISISKFEYDFKGK